MVSDSKFLSAIMRHAFTEYNLVLARDATCTAAEFLQIEAARRRGFTFDTLCDVIDMASGTIKERFQWTDLGPKSNGQPNLQSRFRSLIGHSMDIFSTQ